MGQNSQIGWTDHTHNFWIGCTKTGPRCKFCYAATANRRYRYVDKWGPEGTRRRTQTWGNIAKWNKLNFVQCSVCGWRGEYDGEAVCPTCAHPQVRVMESARQRVFCSSLSDIADDHPSIDPTWYEQIVEIVRVNTNLDFLFCTGRLRNFKNIYLPLFNNRFPENLWVGASISSQEDAEEVMLEMEVLEAKIKFISCEPMLGPVNLRRWLPPTVTGLRPSIDWMINGAESGDERRPYNPQWSQELYEQCSDAGVKFFMKQGSSFWPGKQGEIPDELWKIKEFPFSGKYTQQTLFHQMS